MLRPQRKTGAHEVPERPARRKSNRSNGGWPAMKRNLPISGNEVAYPASANILSTTNLKGTITYVNPEFIDISGFSEDELIGRNHNVIRHPEMPPAAFEDLWQAIQAGQSWMGMVKNRCKNGDHYWVSAYVTPVVRDGEVVEYQSVRTKPDRRLVERAEQTYAAVMAGRPPPALRLPPLGLRMRILGSIGLGVLAGLRTRLFFGGGRRGSNPGQPHPGLHRRNPDHHRVTADACSRRGRIHEHQPRPGRRVRRTGPDRFPYAGGHHQRDRTYPRHEQPDRGGGRAAGNRG